MTYVNTKTYSSRSRRWRGSARLALAVAVAAVPACGGADPASDSADVISREVNFEDEDVLEIDLADSPSQSADFNFCLTPSKEQHLNLTNVAWLNLLAANEYAHFGYLGPQLNELGFHAPDPDPDSIEMIWDECGVDLKAMAKLEQEEEKFFQASIDNGTLRKYLSKFLLDGSEQWGFCAQKWFNESGYKGEVFPTTSMERWLVQDIHPGQYLQFLSGGKASADGKTFKKDSTQALFARHSTLPIAIVSFRGTEPPAEVTFETLTEQLGDIGADLAAFQKDIPGWGEGHSGILSQFRSLEDRLIAKIDELDPDTQIWVTGHSLGGGLATFMAMRLFDDMKKGKERNFKGVVTFGSPRVGDRDFVQIFDAAAHKFGVQSVRVRNNNDVVTNMPPSFTTYHHVDRLLYLTPGALELPFTILEDPEYDTSGAVGDHMIGTGYYNTLMPLYRSGAYAKYDDCSG